MHGIHNSVHRPIGIHNSSDIHRSHHQPESSQTKNASAQDDLSGFAMHNDPDFENREYKSLDAKLNRFTTPHLSKGNRTFDKAMKGGVLNVRSLDLRSVMKQLEKTQNDMTPASLDALAGKIKSWIRHCPREYEELGGLEADHLMKEIEIRKQDPLLGTGNKAYHNSDLLKSVKDIHGEQVAAFLTRVAPELDSHERTNIETKDLLRQTLDTPYMKSFKAAESMVSHVTDHPPGAPLQQSDLSRITEQVAKLPEPLISLLQDQSVKVVTTKNSVEDHLRETSSKIYGDSAKNANAYYTGSETGEVIVAMHKSEEGWMPPSSKREGFTNPVLFHLGAALDNTVGKNLLGHPLRQDPEFVKAWEADKGRFANDKVGTTSAKPDDVGLRTAFSEGLAKAFNNNGNEHPESDKPEWPAIQHYMTEILPKRLGVEFPAS